MIESDSLRQIRYEAAKQVIEELTRNLDAETPDLFSIKYLHARLETLKEVPFGDDFPPIDEKVDAVLARSSQLLTPDTE